MRWKKKILSLALFLAGMAGCKQQCYLTECDYKHYQDHLAGEIEFKPSDITVPASVVHTGTPSTILDPDRPIRYMSLAEAISMSLESGTTGSTAVSPGGIGAGGQATDFIPSGIGTNTTDKIRVLALDPAIVATQVELALSKFDTVWSTSTTWNTTDRPVGTALDVFQTGRSAATNAIQQDNANFSTTLLKQLPTGGVAGITFGSQYQFTNLPARVNPAYTPNLQFQFEQPLLQGFGVEINQLRSSHPGSILNPGISQSINPQGVEGILITRVRHDQSRADFERLVQVMVTNVETAYWNLYGAYWNLYARELGLRLAHKSWEIVGAQFYGGKAPLSDFARTRGQYELFRSQRISALGQILESERQLRKLLGMRIEDGTRLVPSDTPTLAPYQPDYQTAKNEALTLRPELIVAREELKIRQLNLIEQRNALLPDVRLTATYGINSIGSKLDGPDARNALRNLADADFANWEIGVRANIPLGFRIAHSNVRRARLDMARSYYLLLDQEDKAVAFLDQQYRRLFEFYEQVRALRAQREAYGLQLKLLLDRVGEQLLPSDTQVLEAQRFFTDALANEQNAVVQYNNALALFEYSKGTILLHNNIVIGEAGLPCCASERASEHYSKRNHAIELARRPVPLHCPNGDCKEMAIPILPKDEALSLAQLQDSPKPKETRPIDALTPPMPMKKADVPEVQLPTTSPIGEIDPARPLPPAPPVGGSEQVKPLSRMFPGGSGLPAKSKTDVPPARQEQFGAARVLTSPVSSTDPAPSLAPHVP